MSARRMLELGGVVAGIVLIIFGIGSLVLGLNARSTVRDELEREFIVGSDDMNPADTEKAVAGSRPRERADSVVRRRRKAHRDRH